MHNCYQQQKYILNSFSIPGQNTTNKNYPLKKKQKICAFLVNSDGLSLRQANVDSRTKVGGKKNKRKTNIYSFIYYSRPLNLHLITLKAQQKKNPKHEFTSSVLVVPSVYEKRAWRGIRR